MLSGMAGTSGRTLSGLLPRASGSGISQYNDGWGSKATRATAIDWKMHSTQFPIRGSSPVQASRRTFDEILPGQFVRIDRAYQTH